MKYFIPAILVLTAVLLPIRAFATSVYVYKTGNYTPIQITYNIHSICFSSDSMTIVTESQKSNMVSYADFDYFRFYKTQVPTGVEKVESDDLALLFNGETLTLQSPTPMEQVEVYSVSGITLDTFNPGESTFNYSVASLPAGIYFIKVITDGNAIVKKINKK